MELSEEIKKFESEDESSNKSSRESNEEIIFEMDQNLYNQIEKDAVEEPIKIQKPAGGFYALMGETKPDDNEKQLNEQMND